MGRLLAAAAAAAGPVPPPPAPGPAAAVALVAAAAAAAAVAMAAAVQRPTAAHSAAHHQLRSGAAGAWWLVDLQLDCLGLDVAGALACRSLPAAH